MTHAEDRLAAAIAKRDAFTERHFPTDRKLDHGVLNTPVSKRRGNFDGAIDSYKALQRAVDYWQAKVSAERRREQVPAVREARVAAHASADLKAQYEGCTDVLWTLSGRWHPVVRWNAKSVTVNMNGSRESIPHDQVSGAR